MLSKHIQLKGGKIGTENKYNSNDIKFSATWLDNLAEAK